MSVLRVVKKFGTVLSEHQKLRIAELAILMVIGGFLEMCSVSLVIPFMNAVMKPEETMAKWYAKAVCSLTGIQSARTFLVIMAVILAFVYILKNGYLLLEFHVQYRFVYGNMFEMQRRLLDNYIHRPYEYFLKVNSGEIIRIVNNDTPNAFILLSTLLSLFTELVVSGILIAAVFVITPFTTICMAVVLLFMLIVISAVIKPVLQKAGIMNQKASAGMNKWLLQSVHGIKEIKIMGKETYFQDNYDSYGYEYVKALRKNYILNITPRFFIEAVSMGTMFIVAAVMVYMGNDLEMIVPMLTAVAMAAMRLLPSVNRISSSIASIAYNEPMLDKLIENLRSISISSLKEEKETRCRKIVSLKEEIRLNDLYFHYPGAANDILSGVSLTIHSGESVGIVGSSGAGKTTAVDIILGLLHPQKGQILVDGTDISYDIQGWHEQIGYIPQMIFMLDDTVRHNICFGVDEKDISEDSMWRAIEEASLADFIRSLPEGADTEIGERGVRLSGGQRQRIGIARALYRSPSVLVFDEATSALDHDTEAAIMDSISRLRGMKTMIIIAHRLTTIEGCDHVYRVENGRIIMER